MANVGINHWDKTKLSNLSLPKLDKDKIKQLAKEFTAQTFGNEIPKGYCFSTCFALSILFDMKGIKNSMSYGEFPSGQGTYPTFHTWITLKDNVTILDPTIRQFDENMESVYIGKLLENQVTQKYIPNEDDPDELFISLYDRWKKPLIGQHLVPIQIQNLDFEEKMIHLNIKTAIVLYTHILREPSGDKFLITNKKCGHYFSPVIFYLKTKSKAGTDFINSFEPSIPNSSMLIKELLQFSITEADGA